MHVSCPFQNPSFAFTDGQSTMNPFQLSSQIMPCAYSANSLDGAVQPSRPPHLPDLHQSLVITNITHFLNNCGEILQVPSTGGITPHNLRSGIAIDEIKKLIITSYISPLRGDEALDGVSAHAIVSIMERFVDLGRLRSIEEVQGYMALIGIEVLPYDQTIVQYLRLVHELADKAEKSLKKLECEICRKALASKFNLKRHRETVHGTTADCQLVGT
ncbi:hypothetical protein ACHAPU_007531 [Fusarium lateritium]